MVAGRDAATFGEAKNSWLTGTAAWTFVDVSQFILGIQPTLAELKIDPGIPRTRWTALPCAASGAGQPMKSLWRTLTIWKRELKP